MKATIRDIATAAGVGTATVERVLNGRGGVRPDTTEKVLAAARRLDYARRLPEQHRGVLRIEVILVRPETTFFARLSRSFERIAASLDPFVSIHRTFVDEADPGAIANRIGNPHARRSGLVLAVPQYDEVSLALKRLLRDNVPVLQIVTRLEDVETDFIGIDNEAAGRTAGQLMAALQPRQGPVLVLCHSDVYSIHRQRVRGFADALRRHNRGNLGQAEIAHTHDDPMRAAEILQDALRRSPDLAGLYNAGGGNFALCDVLRKFGSGRVTFIGHELTERTTAALRDGTMHVVIDQAPEAQARRAIDLMLSRLGVVDAKIENPSIRFVTVTTESV
ncbi:LacI family DNA-binding transcriptional regulator [Mesorhizobium sp. LHD-90]|nr:LacI family DNA-binding transcriptional regulator [Mesorhizobium sp. LHD-90]MDQ6432861.1 LacI family DNA-binding transcriptional regulator [Mesorhizobium sp. LHD-90]